jgi:hypothetical protein
MNNKLKSAAIGGLITGILSLVPFISTCCCLWAILGGGLAAFLYVKGSSAPVSTGDGAIIGALSGLVGGLIYLIVGLPMTLIFGAAQIEDALRQSGMQAPLSGIALGIVGTLVVAVLLVLFSTIGGLVGVAIFEKRKGGNEPPPPPGFTGGAGGFGSV